LVNVDLDHLDSLDPELYKNLLYLKVKYHTHYTTVVEPMLFIPVLVPTLGKFRFRSRIQIRIRI
jgi:hypothetical protein